MKKKGSKKKISKKEQDKNLMTFSKDEINNVS